MADESEPPAPLAKRVEPVTVDGVLLDCEGARLETIRDVMKATAAACRLLRAGKMDTREAGCLINGYAVLLKALQDQRDSKWVNRAKQMWGERNGSADARPNH